MTPRQELEKLGIDYKILAEYFGYKPVVFANSTRRELIEAGALSIVKHVQNENKGSK